MRVLHLQADTTVVEVGHVEGRIMNVLCDVSPTRIERREFKRRYDATFINDFIPEGAGTRFRVTA